MTLFKVCVIGSGSKNYWEEKKVDGESITVEWNNQSYTGTVRDSWFTRYGGLGRWFHGEEGEHLLIFHEKASEPIIHGVVPEISSQNLMKAYNYKGVDPALKDQFTERSALDLPWWAIVTFLVVFIVVFLIIAFKQGWLIQVFNPKPKPKPQLAFLLMRALRRS